MDKWPLAYFITVACYGTHLYGHPSGSVDRRHNRYLEPRLPPDPDRCAKLIRRLKYDPFLLSSPQRDAVLRAITEVCSHRGWRLRAAHVRTTHFHSIVSAACCPEHIMKDLKSCATMGLRKAHLVPPRRTCWTRHGSTIYLWTDKQFEEAMDYVRNRQGKPMAVYPTET